MNCAECNRELELARIDEPVQVCGSGVILRERDTALGATMYSVRMSTNNASASLCFQCVHCKTMVRLVAQRGSVKLHPIEESVPVLL